MGFRIRKRSRTSKNTWINWFGSGKGAGASISVRSGNATVNVGRNRVRTTYNFGGGLTWVSQRSLKKKETADPKSRSNRDKRLFGSSYDYQQEIDQENFDVEMKRAMMGMTVEEYTAWYDALSDEAKLEEDKRVDVYLDKFKKRQARKRAYSRRYREPKLQSKLENVVDFILNIFFGLIVLIFNPWGIFLTIIAIVAWNDYFG